jgi:hypothetical protein
MTVLADLLLAAPALPLDEAGKYIAGAYLVFVVLLVVYVGIMAAKLSRISGDLEELTELAERRRDERNAAAATPSAAASSATGSEPAGGDRVGAGEASR